MTPQDFPSRSDAFGDGLAYAIQSHSNVGEDQDMKEPESAGNDLAFSKSFLGSISALLRNIFDASAGTIMVMVKQMQRSEVSNIT